MIQNNKDNVSIWLIGPSAAGKTTVSKLLYDEIKEKMNLVIIDGDQVRNLYENNLGYDKNSRSKNTKRYINLVNWLVILIFHQLLQLLVHLKRIEIIAEKK